MTGAWFAALVLSIALLTFAVLQWLEPIVSVRFQFAWYDLWVGVYIDTEKRRVWVCPFPCCVFCFEGVR